MPTIRRVSVIEPDYNSDPGRSQAWDPAWIVVTEDWDEGAGRLAAEGLAPVLDIGCGYGGFAAQLPASSRWIGIDASSVMLAQTTARPVVQADALRLPVHDDSVGAVVCRNLLYHFADPSSVIVEAYRVLRPGGLLLAQTKSRHQDPELVPEGYPPSTFDAEEAPQIVSTVFGPAAIEVESWDGPFMVLPDQAAVASYARHSHLPGGIEKGISTPLTLTKKGCLVWARK